MVDKSINRKQSEIQEDTSRLARRALLQSLVAGSTITMTAATLSKSILAGHSTDSCGGASINFNQCHVARISPIDRSGVNNLTIFYFDADHVAHKRTKIDPEMNSEYGPVKVRYVRGNDQTVIQIGEDSDEGNASLRRVVAFGDDCRTSKTNPQVECAGTNQEPMADFTWSPADPRENESVAFTSTASDPDGDLIHYDWNIDESSEDITGQEVTYTFDAAGEYDVIHTVIDDFEATDEISKTVTVEQPWEERVKLTASDGDDFDRFGRSVSLDSEGATAVVGAPYDEDPNGDQAGSAYVYDHKGEEWTETKLSASDGDSLDRFGFATALSADGSTALIGAIKDEDPNGRKAGSVYIYEQMDGEWAATKLAASDGDNTDRFGQVTLNADGSTALVGAPTDEDSNGDRAGSAYVYEKRNGNWIETKLTASDGDTDDVFGLSVALNADGTTALVGAPSDEDPNGGNSGAAYVYEKANGEWGETKISASDGEIGDSFGFSVELNADGSTVLVGARYGDNQGNGTGAAYLFEQGAGKWTETKLTASNSNRFESVALSDDGATVLVGDISSAYVYERLNGEWSKTNLTAPGGSVALSADGSTALLGDFFDDSNGDDSGSAYVFR